MKIMEQVERRRLDKDFVERVQKIVQRERHVLEILSKK
jgi:hypothetical protein